VREREREREKEKERERKGRERGVRDGMDAAQYADGLSGILAPSLSWGRTAKYLRIVTIATPLRPPPPSSPDQQPPTQAPFDRVEWVNAIDSRAQGAWAEAAATTATV